MITKDVKLEISNGPWLTFLDAFLHVPNYW
jgi:hypothetical protein